MWTISLIFLSVFLSCDMSSSVLTSTSSTTSSTHTFDETTTTTDAAAATVAYQDQTSASRDLDQYDQKKETENDFKITINITTNSQMVTTGSKLDQMVTTGSKLDQMVTTGSKLDQMVTTGSKLDQMVTTGYKLDQMVTTGSKLDQMVTTGSKLDQMVTTGSKLDQMVTTGSKLDHIVTTGSKLDQMVTTGSKLGQRVTTGSKLDQMVTTGSKLDHIVTTGSKLDHMVTTGFKLDQMVTTQPNVLDTTSDIYNSYSESQAQDLWTLDSETKRLLEKPKVVEPQHILTTQRNSEHKVDGPQHLLTTQRDSQHKMKTVIRLHNPFMKTRQSQHFLKNSKIRSGRKSITIKPLIKYDIDNNQDGEYDTLVGIDKNENSELDTLEGIDYDDDSIYTLAHFRFELYSHVDDRISILNVSVLQLLASMQEKITQLETQVLDNMDFRCALESKLRIDVNPQPGDIRLLSQGNCGKDITTGYLQFYTGTDWGFVCDDFFNSAAARVSCNQLGYAESNSSTMSARRSSKSYKTGSSLGQTWSERFSIVLDDVQCTGNENNLDSCEHSGVGHHDCSLDELVFLTC